MRTPPPWWDWPLELSPHLLKRMVDRDFTEIELRTMLDRADRLEPAATPGRWLVHTRHAHAPWVVVVEAMLAEEVLVVITAYPQSRQQ